MEKLFCSKCGKELPIDSQYCDECGTSLKPITEKKDYIKFIIVGIFISNIAIIGLLLKILDLVKKIWKFV